MKSCKITALRRTQYDDLMAEYENPIEHTCDVCLGQTWISHDGKCPEGLCESAWQSMEPFVRELAAGGGNFYDGFRPVSFYIETDE